MSDGAPQDQLFLALRLAHVANHCALSEACPVILDDVLMAFDDARATAAMKALSELAETTQVLLFTHHKHHVDLANQTLGTAKFRLHELAACR
jgi:DNA repair protein SbcC/Rad50